MRDILYPAVVIGYWKTTVIMRRQSIFMVSPVCQFGEAWKSEECHNLACLPAFLFSKVTHVCTCDADLGWPLGGTIQDALLDSFHLLGVGSLGDSKDLLDQLKDLRFIALPDLHAIFQHHDDVLCPVFCSMLGTFLRRSWTQREAEVWHTGHGGIQ